MQSSTSIDCESVVDGQRQAKVTRGVEFRQKSRSESRLTFPGKLIGLGEDVSLKTPITEGCSQIQAEYLTRSIRINRVGVY